jgi:hypothetical protein
MNSPDRRTAQTPPHPAGGYTVKEERRKEGGESEGVANSSRNRTMTTRLDAGSRDRADLLTMQAP